MYVCYIYIYIYIYYNDQIYHSNHFLNKSMDSPLQIPTIIQR